jgi:hypothetical protein
MKTSTIPWQNRQAHEEQVTEVLRDQGCFDTLGRLRAFDGRKVWPALYAAGHDAFALEKCSCRTRPVANNG